MTTPAGRAVVMASCAGLLLLAPVVRIESARIESASARPPAAPQQASQTTTRATPQATPQAKLPAGSPALDLRQTLDRYCVTCHSDRVRASGLSLQPLDVS